MILVKADFLVHTDKSACLSGRPTKLSSLLETEYLPIGFTSLWLCFITTGFGRELLIFFTHCPVGNFSVSGIDIYKRN